MTTNNYELADALRKTLPELAEKLAAEMGEGWYRSDDGDSRYNVHISGPDGERITLAVDPGKPEHIAFDGHLPGEIHGSGTYTRDLRTQPISVAASRGVPVMAKEIRRRLMPAYLEVLATARQRLAETRRDQARRDEVAARVAELLGVPARGPGRYDGPNDAIRIYSRANDRVEVRVGGYVEIEVRGDFDALRDVIAAIGGLA